MINKRAIVSALIVSFAIINSYAADYYVSSNGADNNPGTKSKPFARFSRAMKELRPGDTCYIRAGVYRETLRPERSGTPNAAIRITNFNNEKVVLNACGILGGWKPEGDGTWAAPMEWDLKDQDQVFLNGRYLPEAGWPAAGPDPLFHPVRARAESGSPNTLSDRNIPGGTNAWKGAKLWCAGGRGWICWTAGVTSYNSDTHTLTFDKTQKQFYVPRKSNPYVLRGVRRALHAPGQWFHDREAGRLLIIPPQGTDMAKAVIEAKRRLDVIDLSGKSHIRISGLDFRAGGIKTDQKTSHVVLEGMKGEYVAHSFDRDVSSHAGVRLLGHDILVLDCDFGYSSASVLTVKGADNRVINCSLHHGGYAGLWRGTVVLSGRRIVFSHNTVRHAGRDLVNTHGLMESLVQYNDLSDAGWLTTDLGMLYGHNTDFANTVFHHNLVHDSHTEHCAMGIYFDHLSHNAIVHNNVVWNVGRDPLRFNNPSYCNLVYSNTCWKTGHTSTFDHSKRNDLFACRYTDNILVAQPKLPGHVVVTNNLVSSEPPLVDPDKLDFRTKPGTTVAGAIPPGTKPWRAGRVPGKPPSPLPVYRAPRVPWMNIIKNACFEFGTLEGWKVEGGGAELVKGNDWGSSRYGGEDHATGTSKFELQLGTDGVRVSQKVIGLEPDTEYTLSAWCRVEKEGDKATLLVRGDWAKGEQSAGFTDTEWTRKSVTFRTGSKGRQVTVSLMKTASKGLVWFDNLTLPLVSSAP